MTAETEWLGLRRTAEGRWSFDLTAQLARHDGHLYGGTGIAAAVAIMEAETGREALWATVQFAGTAAVGDRVEYTIETLAGGRRTSQVRFSARAADREIIVGVGATGTHASTQLVDMQVPTMPEVPGPGHGAPWGIHRAHEGLGSSWTDVAEVRQVDLDSSRFVVWGRMRDGRAPGRAALSFMADLLPISVARAAGRLGAGASLDNSMRFGRTVPTNWVLFDFEPWFTAGGYLHGGARVWSEDGTLLAYASQTAAARTLPTELTAINHSPREMLQ
jgi:acyl-CoA thioesterase